MTGPFPYIASFIRREIRKIQIITGVSPLQVAYVSFSLVTERTTKELENRKLPGQEQAGFRENASCCDHAFVLYAVTSRYLAKKKRLFVTFVDYEKAFDRVDHSLL